MCPARRIPASSRSLRPSSASLRVVVVGGGFAGAVAALRLMEASNGPLAITVVEPRPQLGRGIAYSTTELGHLMNGPARSLSLYPEAPLHFVRWLQAEARRGGWFPPPDASWEACQPPRWHFGTYVETRLAASAADNFGRVRLRHRRDRAVGIGQLGREYVVALADSGPLLADAVVLASGVFQKGSETSLAGPLRDDPRYVADPYAADAFTAAAGAEDAIVLGSGLAMLDAVVSLDRAGFRDRIRAISRRGQLVEPRRNVEASDAFAGCNVTSLRGLVRRVQEERRALAARGEDWQRLIPAVRDVTPRLWTRLSPNEQKRFVRHLQGVWKSCVHLAPVETHRLAGRLQAEGRLTLAPGQINGLTADADGKIHVRVVAADESVETLRGDLVVNCLGHSADWSELGDPLVRSLLDRGLARPHATGLGIDVDPASHAVIGASGRPSGRLFAIGHPLRGAVWESSSIREIATQARTLGEMLAEVAEASRAAGRAPRLVRQR